ncbi:MAG TPA: radical SAM protein [Bacteroidetes bacterium]|nr:radical SAM protein [Bacteroidota bacterium]
MRRFLLLNPCIHDFAAYDFWVKPLGLLSLAAILEGAGAQVRLLDCLDRHDPGWLRWTGQTRPQERWDGTGKFHREPLPKPAPFAGVPRRFARYGWSLDYLRLRLQAELRPDAVLVTSGMTYWYPGVQEAIHEVKRLWPNALVLLGGIYATLCREHAREHSGADVVLPGPLSPPNLHKLWDVLNLPGHPPDGDWFVNLERLPYHLYPRLRTAAVLTSLGCPYRCPFCASHLLVARYRRRDPLVVAREIAALRFERGVEHFAFFDDALLLAHDRHFSVLAEELLRLRVRASFHTPNGLHVREIDEDVARLMHDTGFRTLWLSYESSNPDRQQQMGGKVSDQDFDRAVGNLVRAGYRRSELGAYVLGGLPDQTVREVLESLFAVAERRLRSSLAIFSPIPGTAEWARAVEAGAFPADADPLLTNDTICPVRTQEFSPPVCQRLRQVAKALNRFVRTSQPLPEFDRTLEWVVEGADPAPPRFLAA